MDIQILLGLLLTILPVFELRGGLPLIVEYTARNGLLIWPYFLLVLLLNILVIFLVFLFLDFLHESFMNFKPYRSVMSRVLRRIRRKSDRVEKQVGGVGYIALAALVAIPLPGTGAWTGALIAWMLGLSRWKSFIAIAAGVVIAGFIVLLASLGLFGLYYPQ